MNKWEIEVQKSLLDSEETAIKELEKQYKRALKDIEDKIKLFDYDIRQLEDAINADGLDDAAREVLKSQQRAKVYQKQYQQALKGQISGIVDNLHAQQYATIDKYLKECYTDSFVGTMYSIAKQGVPLIMPIDQAAVVKAVLTDSKIVEGYYNHLGVNYAKLKKVITQEASRGIASGLSYAEIARNINNASKSGLYNAKRIARTEGHRIQQTSADDARQGAIKRGADLVKQWDAALDKRTRPSHARVDGEIREEGEKFSNGLLYPGDPNGSAEEVINCRCVALSRARWALDESELETLKERAEYFGLDKTKNFDDFREKYINAAPKPQVATQPEFKEITNAIDFAYGNYTDEDYNKWWDDYDAHNANVKLSAEELKIIDDYTEGSFIGLNEVSRFTDTELIKKGYTADDIKSIRDKADLLEGALSKYDLDTDIVTHRFERNVSWLTGKGNDIDALEALKGTEYTTKGFTSSGMLPNRFRFTGGKSDAVHFEIVTPKGTNGAFLSMSKKGENEFLYNRNTKYRVIDGGERVVKENKFNFKTMQMEEVDVKERFLRVQVIPDKATENAMAKPVIQNGASAIKKTGIKALDTAKVLSAHDVDDCYNTTNPLYSKGREYQVNCQRCVSAYEARRRGYDVAAAKALMNNSDTLPYMMHQKGWANVYKDGLASLETPTGSRSTAIKKSIEAMMSGYGDGARAIIRVQWQGGGGHVFIAEQNNGKTEFIDPQPGKRDCSHYFNAGMIKPASTRLLRIDNKDFTDLIEQCIIQN